jgi:hypothetical protein
VGHNMPPAKAGFRVPFIVILALIGLTPHPARTGW